MLHASSIFNSILDCLQDITVNTAYIGRQRKDGRWEIQGGRHKWQPEIIVFVGLAVPQPKLTI